MTQATSAKPKASKPNIAVIADHPPVVVEPSPPIVPAPQIVSVEINDPVPFTINIKMPVPNTPYSGNFIGYTQVPLLIRLPVPLTFAYPSIASAQQLLEETLVDIGKVFYAANERLTQYVLDAQSHPQGEL